MIFAAQDLIEGVAAVLADTSTLDAIFADEDVELVSVWNVLSHSLTVDSFASPLPQKRE